MASNSFIVLAVFVAVINALVEGEVANKAIEESCSLIFCAEGYECDPVISSCVPVSCEAYDACPEDSICSPRDIFCIRNPCPQFTCEVSCTENTCAHGYDCDSFTGTCAPVTCDAPDACKTNERCLPLSVQCASEPCPQLQCVPEGCTTTCGNFVELNSIYQDDGENSCNLCLCLGGDNYCVPWYCPTDVTDFNCDSGEAAECLTSCGRTKQAGEFFQDDGTNYCNSCTCTATGELACTRAFCDAEAVEAECNCVICPQVVPTCEDGCGNCQITPQTCDSCSFATCLDN